MTRACQECGRPLLLRRGLDLIDEDGRTRTLCELCAKPATASMVLATAGPDAAPLPPADPEPVDVVGFFPFHLAEVARAAAGIARAAGAEGAWRLKVDEAEEEAIRCLRAVEAAGDAVSQGDPKLDGLPAVARAARAAADALDAAAAAVRAPRVSS